MNHIFLERYISIDLFRNHSNHIIINEFFLETLFYTTGKILYNQNTQARLSYDKGKMEHYHSKINCNLISRNLIKRSLQISPFCPLSDGTKNIPRARGASSTTLGALIGTLLPHLPCPIVFQWGGCLKT